MRRILIATALLGLVTTHAEARDGWHGRGHGGGGHFPFFAAPLIFGALTLPYFLSRTWAAPAPYYYPDYYPSTTVYVQSPPTYVVTDSQQGYVPANNQAGAVHSPSHSNQVIELGPISALHQGSNSGQTPPIGTWFVYPSKGQSPERQVNDRNECGSWAASQLGVDANASSLQTGSLDYGRALSACLEGRGYAVK